VDNTPKDNAIYTAETRTMEMEFMDSNNPLKSNSIKLNIEAALLQSPMTIARPPGAETYLWGPNNGQRTRGNTAANAGLAYMNFQVPVNGSYRIWGLVQGDTNNDNGFYVRVRDGNAILNGTRTWDFTASSRFEWREVSGGSFNNLDRTKIYQLE